MGSRFLMLFVGALVLTLSLPAAAQWKWKDSRGQTQYSDLPPPQGTPEQNILARPSASQRGAIASPPASSASAAAAGASGLLSPKVVDPELEARRKKAELELLAKSKADDANVASAKMDNCSRAKGALRSLDSGQRLTRTNDKGEREFLDDTQRAEEAKRMRSVMAADCK
jgi:hypothetical protein